MSPLDRNELELERIRSLVESGQPIDSAKEDALADIDNVIAEAYYTRQAIERVNEADDIMESLLNE